jgi:hypothetical protein
MLQCCALEYTSSGEAPVVGFNEHRMNLCFPQEYLAHDCPWLHHVGNEFRVCLGKQFLVTEYRTRMKSVVPEFRFWVPDTFIFTFLNYCVYNFIQENCLHKLPNLIEVIWRVLDKITVLCFGDQCIFTYLRLICPQKESIIPIGSFRRCLGVYPYIHAPSRRDDIKKQFPRTQCGSKRANLAESRDSYFLFIVTIYYNVQCAAYARK